MLKISNKLELNADSFQSINYGKQACGGGLLGGRICLTKSYLKLMSFSSIGMEISKKKITKTRGKEKNFQQDLKMYSR
ncbi:hypothetical protein BpHYR1_044957 [Brachionus plicatilis]|uniref:Uncharacterized protein n=1 Tax=Brachionus plicatilis TaxID=10195 RepID=A0A3M7S0Y1_BRAPC|nr:hypothetical protein BpHYR1_044957 [Brachionus plicatilis]